jgi:glycosyltransferase involved in cell wall biosynthesis
MTAVSRRVASEVQAFAPTTTFSILPNAIDTSFWTPAADETKRDPVHLVFAGRLQAKKRPMLVLHALRGLVIPGAARDPRSDWRLTIIGDGPLEIDLREAALEFGLADRVNFVGWVDRSRLRGIYRSADIFLSTSARESFGLAALEARACGVPVIAIEDSAVSDFITHELSGLLARNDKDFAAAIARLVRDTDLRHRIADFNRRTPVPFNWERAIEMHEEAYTKAAALVSRGND